VVSLCVALISMALLGPVACGAPAAEVQVQPRVDRQVQRTERLPPASVDAVFDPAEHRSDDIRAEAERVIRDITAPHVDVEAAIVDTNLSVPTDTTWIAATGYRIQISVSPTRDQAEDIAEVARQRFPYDSVYVYFQAPWHKVRIGDLDSRQTAKEKMNEARQKGYREAFLVPSEIRVMEFIHEDGNAVFIDDARSR
jgi:hypothetical protein